MNIHELPGKTVCDLIPVQFARDATHFMIMPRPPVKS